MLERKIKCKTCTIPCSNRYQMMVLVHRLYERLCPM
uniref:Uncharacterized protein n=2 Tax=Anguilla anguilla TaxID=7936 RepID=A0A0E9RBJ6_ANGAN